jgi:cation diffusion facilitator CzcD-associated flavoprotein CzcO
MASSTCDDEPMGRGDRHLDFDVVILGAGFCGLYALWRLRGEGFRVRVVEAGAGNGGVWHWNAYPGARVDSHWPNYEFSLESVWRNWYWSERFPGRDELCRYFDHAVDVLDLGAYVELGRRVVTADFDPASATWTTVLDDGRSINSRYVILAIGFAAQPYVPELPGLADFTGECHHTARWPQRGVDLSGRRVGVFGTGATGVQVVQEVAKVAAELTVFQRTPAMALPMGQRQLTRAEQDRAKEGFPEFFARRRVGRGGFGDMTPCDVGALEVDEDERRAVFDKAWAAGGLHFWAGTFADILLDEDANRTAYDYWRDKTVPRITDPRVAELLAPQQPAHPFGTKRPPLEQGYYEAFNQPNVHLVDLRATPIEQILPTGVRTAAGDHDVDVLVLATGFDANTGGVLRLDLRDTEGRSLRQRWATGVETHLGIAIPGVPNMLMLYGPQSPTAFWNGPTCAEVQGDWVTDLLVHLRARGDATIEATDDAAQTWTTELDLFGEATLLGKADSWYMAANIPGKRRQLLNHPSSDQYRQRLNDCAAGGYSGFLITYRSV